MAIPTSANNKKKGLLRLNEVAKGAGVLPSTVRYYSNIGLIKVACRSPGGHRLYDRAALAWLKRIRAVYKNRVTLEELRKRLR